MQDSAPEITELGLAGKCPVVRANAGLVGFDIWRRGGKSGTRRFWHAAVSGWPAGSPSRSVRKWRTERFSAPSAKKKRFLSLLAQIPVSMVLKRGVHLLLGAMSQAWRAAPGLPAMVR